MEPYIEVVGDLQKLWVLVVEDTPGVQEVLL